MLTKEIFRESVDTLLQVHKVYSTLYGIGIDISESMLDTGAFKLFDKLLESHFSKEDCDVICEWVYDRVFDIQKTSGQDLDVKINYIYNKDGEVVVDNFDSLCEYYGIE